MQRSPGILPCDCAQRLRGWLTVHPWTGSQLARIPASHPAGLFSAATPLHRGPVHCASCAAKTKRFPARCGFGFGSCFALRHGAQDARYQGPVSGGGRAQERPAGWARGIAPSSLPAHGGAVSEPPEPCREVGGQDARRPPLWGGLLLTPGSCPSPCGPASPFALLLQRSACFSLTPGSCPPPCGPAALFAPLLRRSGHARESRSLAEGE